MTFHQTIDFTKVVSAFAVDKYLAVGNDAFMFKMQMR